MVFYCSKNYILYIGGVVGEPGFPTKYYKNILFKI